MPLVRPYIPNTISVHLGVPASNAQNEYVSFPDYIKNVASSEIYPTWNDSAIVANIYAQISYALNRIYLEFYRSQGFNFDITNSTAYDQKFIPGRNIFENISKIVDDIFNNYIRRVGSIEPLAAKYCNGTTVTCDGLSQWGSEDLASQGYNSIEILKYFYGDDIELVVDAPIQDIIQSYPGTPIRLGSSGSDVYVLQSVLNRISSDYPAIPKINPVNGTFDEATERAVREFQRIFNLTVDGIVGKATWYKAVFLYNGITRLSELDAEGQTLFGIQLEYPDAISIGDVGEKVLILQYMLSVISEFYSNVPEVEVTGTFSEDTKNAVIQFQKGAGLPENGVVGDRTWDAIYREFIGIVNIFFFKNYPLGIRISPFPGTTLKLGSRGKDVRALQQYINTLSLVFPDISPIPVTGVYDQQTMLSVMQFQRMSNMPTTGEVDRNTWNSIVQSYQTTLSASLPLPKQFPGQTLKLGSQDKV